MQNNGQKGSLKDKFQGFGAEPSDELWNAIAGELDEKKKRPLFFWWWFAGLAATVVIALSVIPPGSGKISGAQARSGNHKPENAVASARRSLHQEQRQLPHSAKAGSFSETTSPSERHFPLFIVSHEKKYGQQNILTGIPNPLPAQQLSENLLELQESTVDTLAPLKLAVSKDILNYDSSYHANADGRPNLYPIKWTFPLEPKWKISASYSSANSLGEYIYIDYSQPFVSGDNPDVWSTPDNYQSLQATIARKAGRWWFETGIQPGIFKAVRYTGTSAANTEAVKARTFTIGIPVAIRLDVYRNTFTHTQLYMRFGTVQNFPFYRSETYTPVNNSHSPYVVERNFFNYLGSVSATLGIEQHIWRGLSADFRPEFHYYYKPPTNSYENPVHKAYWWFDVNFGLSWSI